MSTFKARSGYYIRKLLPWVACTLAALFYLYEYLLRVFPAIIDGPIVETYHITATTLGSFSFISFFYYIYSPMQIPFGALVDRYNPRYLLTFCGLVCALGVYCFSASNNLFWAEVGNFLVGFGAAFAFVSTVKLIFVFLPERYFALLLGIVVAFGQLGGGVCQTFLPSFVSSEGWRLTGYFLALAGLLLTLGIFVGIQHKENRPRAKLIYTKKLFEGFASTLKNPQFCLLALIACLLYLPTSVFAEFWGVPYLKAVYYLSSVDAENIIAMIFWGWVVGAPLVGYLSTRFKVATLPMTIGASMTAILFSIVLFVPGLTKMHVKGLFFLIGLSSSTQILAIAMCCRQVNKKHVGIAVGLINAFIMFGGFLMQMLVGYFLEKGWSGEILQGGHVFNELSYQLALIVLPVALIASVFLTFFLKDKPLELLYKIKDCSY